jgi:iron-sulfur cluster repair protein YtfE (RIC family)
MNGIPVFLSDYIVNVHHKFVRKNLPELVHYTGKIASVHGMNHPELVVIANLILQVNDELQKHMKKEEEILFPAVREMFSGGSPIRSVKQLKGNFPCCLENMNLQAGHSTGSMK